MNVPQRLQSGRMVLAAALAIVVLVSLAVLIDWTSWALLVGAAVLAIAAAIVIFVGLGLGFPRQRHKPLLDEDDVVTVFGSRIRYRRTPGKGPTILLVHGNNLSIDDWYPMADFLGGREMVALDLVGYAGSDRPPNLAYDKECQRQYLIGFMDALGIDRAVLVGHSMGGTVVGWTAARSPERVVGTVLIAPPGIPGSLIYAWPKSLLTRPGQLNRMASALSRTKPFRMVFPERLSRQGLGITGSYDDAYARALGDVASPMMLIWSSGDTRCPVRYADSYRDSVANIDVRIVSDEIGHMVPMSDPEGTAALIVEFVDGLASHQRSDLIS